MKINISFFFIIIAIFLNSCMVEQRIAYKFQSEIHTTPILFRNSAEIYLISSKEEIPYNVSPEKLNINYDSSFQNSDLVQHIDVYDFKNQFGKYLERELKSNKLNIYSADSIVSFINQSAPRMIVDILQVEIEEYYDIYYDEISEMPAIFNATNKYLQLKEADLHSEYDNDGSEYYYSSIEIPRNAIIVNLWLQIDIWLLDSIHKSTTVFMDYAFSDFIEGTFIMKNFKTPQYLYTVDSINTYDLWKVAELPTKVFAENIIDFLVNNVVENRYSIIKNDYPTYNYKYKKSSGLIIPYKEELPYFILHEE